MKCHLLKKGIELGSSDPQTYALSLSIFFFSSEISKILCHSYFGNMSNCFLVPENQTGAASCLYFLGLPTSSVGPCPMFLMSLQLVFP